MNISLAALKLLAPDALLFVLLEDPCIRCHAEWQVSHRSPSSLPRRSVFSLSDCSLTSLAHCSLVVVATMFLCLLQTHHLLHLHAPSGALVVLLSLLSKLALPTHPCTSTLLLSRCLGATIDGFEATGTISEPRPQPAAIFPGQQLTM